MLRALAAMLRTIRREGMGVSWFLASNLVTPAVSVLLGPLILRKIGLEQYAVLNLAGFFLMLASVYSDFGSYPHLLAAFAKKGTNRHVDLGCALALRAGLLALFYCGLGVVAQLLPRHDAVYAFLALYMLTLLLPQANGEWYFISKKLYFRLFLVRLAFNACMVLSIGIWLLLPGRDAVVIPIINVIAASAASIFLIASLGSAALLRAVSAVCLVSWTRMRDYLKRIFPLAATQLVVPYFLAYALPWFSLVTADKELEGAFSISYRVMLGFSALMGPLAFYVMSRVGGEGRHIPFRKMAAFSVLSSGGLWISGILLIGFYYWVSGANASLAPISVRYFSILMIGIFCIALRTGYVSRCTLEGRYRVYFWIHFIACAPTLLLSWVAGARLASGLVVWLACMPDIVATGAFIWYFSKNEGVIHKVQPTLPGA